RIVQRKAALRRAVGLEAEIMEQGVAIAFGASPFHEAGGDDLVGVDAGHWQRARDTLDPCDGAHHSRPFRKGRTSVSRPVSAAAATIAGDIRCVRDPAPCLPLKFLLVVE